MNQEDPSSSVDQLAKLYAAANRANSELSVAMRAKPRDRNLVERMRQMSSELNSAYDAARRRFKRQQKSERRESMRTQVIRFYIDVRQHQEQT